MLLFLVSHLLLLLNQLQIDDNFVHAADATILINGKRSPSYPSRLDPEPAYIDPKVPLGVKRFTELIHHFNRNGWMWDNGGGMAVVVQGPTEFDELQRADPNPAKAASSPEDVLTQQKPMEEAITGTEGPGRGKKRKRTESLGDLIYVSPTAVQKEALKPADIFVVPLKEAALKQVHHGSAKKPQPPPKLDKAFINRSRNEASVPSATLNLLRYSMLEHEMGKEKGEKSFSKKQFVAVVHTHSMYANMLTIHNVPRVHKGERSRPAEKLTLANQEMLQAIEDRATGQFFHNLSSVDVPIVRSEHNEDNLLEPMLAALRDNPHASAVIVQRHGLFVWGQHSWQSTKQMVECYEYLLKMEFLLRQMRVQMFMAQFLDAQGFITGEGEFKEYTKAGGIPNYRLERRSEIGYTLHAHAAPAA